MALAALLIPDVTHQALPAVLRLFEFVRRASGLVAGVALFHQFVQFAHVQPAGAADFFGILFVGV